MRPIQQTIEALTQISRLTGERDLLPAPQQLGDKVERFLPDCTGISLAWTEHGVTFTLVASDHTIALLDAHQYFDGRPCVDAVDRGHGIEPGRVNPLDEEQWRMFAQGTAAAAVRSTLTSAPSDLQKRSSTCATDPAPVPLNPMGTSTRRPC